MAASNNNKTTTGDDNLCAACQEKLITDDFPLCLTSCGHIFHRKCIFEEGTNNSKIKYLACPSCLSQQFIPVIPIYPSISAGTAEEEFASPNYYPNMALSTPQLAPGSNTTNKTDLDLMEKEMTAHSALTNQFNTLLKTTLNQEKYCQDKVAENIRLQQEIAAMQKELDELQEGEVNDNEPWHKGSSQSSAATNPIKNDGKPAVAPEYLNISIDNDAAMEIDAYVEDDDDEEDEDDLGAAEDGLSSDEEDNMFEPVSEPEGEVDEDEESSSEEEEETSSDEEDDTRKDPDFIIDDESNTEEEDDDSDSDL